MCLATFSHMNVGELYAAVVADTTGRQVARGGGGAPSREFGATDRRGYPPMSNGGGVPRARKIDQTPHQKYFPPNLQHVPPVIVIPEPDQDDLDFFFPTAFEADPEATVLATAPQKFFKKNIDEAMASRLAYLLLVYFSRPLSGTYEETICNRDGVPTIVRKPYTAPLPLLSEFANMHGLTERELKQVAANSSDLARALEFAKDVVKTNLIRKGLNEEYNPAMVQFTATNETDMKVKSEQTVKNIDVNDLLDRIEKATQPQTYDI